MNEEQALNAALLFLAISSLMSFEQMSFCFVCSCTSTGFEHDGCGRRGYALSGVDDGGTLLVWQEGLRTARLHRCNQQGRLGGLRDQSHGGAKSEESVVVAVIMGVGVGWVSLFLGVGAAAVAVLLAGFVSNSSVTLPRFSPLPPAWSRAL